MEGEYIPKQIKGPKDDKEPKEENNSSKLSGVLRQSLISDLLTLLAGAFLYFASGTIDQIIGISAGIIIIFVGAFNIYLNIKRNESKVISFNLVFNIFLLAIGIFVICSPHIVAQTLTIMLGLLMVIMGFNKIVYSILLKVATFKIWLFSLIVGVLISLFGITIMVDPGSSETLIKIIGILLMVIAVSDLVNLLIIKKQSKGIIELHW